MGLESRMGLETRVGVEGVNGVDGAGLARDELHEGVVAG